ELLLSTFASVHGLRLALAAWNSGAPGAATWNVSCSCFASSSLRALAQPYLNWSTRSVTARFQLAGFPSTGEADFNEEIGSGSTPTKRSRIDRNGGRRQPPSGDDLRQQPAERVPDDGRLLVQLPDHIANMVCDLTDLLPGEDLWMGPRLPDGLRVVGPTGRHRREAGLLEKRGPAVPAACEQPQPVDEHNGSTPRRVRRVNLTRFASRKRRHAGEPTPSSAERSWIGPLD